MTTSGNSAALFRWIAITSLSLLSLCGSTTASTNEEHELKQELDEFKADLEKTMDIMIAVKVDALADKLLAMANDTNEQQQQQQSTANCKEDGKLNEWAQPDAADGAECVKNMEVSGRMVTHGKAFDLCTARAKMAFSVNRFGKCSRRVGRMFYFEVKIVKMTDTIQVGLANGAGAKPTIFHTINNSGHYAGEGRLKLWNYMPEFAEGDVIGCGLLVPKRADSERKLFFTKNGAIPAKVSPILLKPDDGGAVELFPVVRLWGAGNQIQANFGQEPFLYKLVID